MSKADRMPGPATIRVHCPTCGHTTEPVAEWPPHCPSCGADGSTLTEQEN